MGHPTLFALSFDKLTDKLDNITLGINTTIVNKREFQYRNKKNREYSRSNSDNNQHEKNSTDKSQHKKDENNYNYKKSYTSDNKRKEQKTKGNRTQSNYKNKPASKIYDSKSPYEILGVGRNSTDDEIDKRYKILRSQFHSDKFPNMSEKFSKELDEIFKEVKQAYNTLASRRK